MPWENRPIFTATPEDPNHEYIIEQPRFSEISSDAKGLYVMGATKVKTELTSDKNIIIMVFIGKQFVAKDFIFNFTGSKGVTFYRTFYKEKPTDYYGFEHI